jgi:hypothetical protein
MGYSQPCGRSGYNRSDTRSSKDIPPFTSFVNILILGCEGEGHSRQGVLPTSANEHVQMDLSGGGDGGSDFAQAGPDRWGSSRWFRASPSSSSRTSNECRRDCQSRPNDVWSGQCFCRQEGCQAGVVITHKFQFLMLSQNAAAQSKNAVTKGIIAREMFTNGW